jgi:hypothetical protein
VIEITFKNALIGEGSRDYQCHHFSTLHRTVGCGGGFSSSLVGSDLLGKSSIHLLPFFERLQVSRFDLFCLEMIHVERTAITTSLEVASFGMWIRAPEGSAERLSTLDHGENQL